MLGRVVNEAFADLLDAEKILTLREELRHCGTSLPVHFRPYHETTTAVERSPG